MTYTSKRTPRLKQAEAIEFLRDKPVAAFLMAMRTAKTKVIIDDWGSRDIPNLLVIAPAGAYMPWADGVYLDFPAHPSIMRLLMAESTAQQVLEQYRIGIKTSWRIQRLNYGCRKGNAKRVRKMSPIRCVVCS